MPMLLPVVVAFALTAQASVAPPLNEFPVQDAALAGVVRHGLAEMEAARRLEEAPGDIETLRLVARTRNADNLLVSLRAIVQADPTRIPDALAILRHASVVGEFRSDEPAARRRAGALIEIVHHARTRLAALSQEEAARAERVLITLEREAAGASRPWEPAVRRFVNDYRGTGAALLAEVELLHAGPTSREKFEALDAFIAAHPGTTAAAKALFLQGFDLHTINTLGVLEPRGADPIRRFERVQAIVAELQSGRYPPSEWVDRAPELIADFYVPDSAALSPGSVERLLAGYEALVRRAFAGQGPLGDGSIENSRVAYLVTSKMADLFARQGKRVEGVERLLADLERTAAEPAAVRYLRAAFYLGGRGTPLAEGSMLEKAVQELVGLASEGGLYSRKALATLANLELRRGALSVARDAYERYASSYPESPWAWVALVRAGLCEEERGQALAASSFYLDAAARYGDLPVAAVIGHGYAARAFEAAGDFERALAHHRRAHEAWDDRFGARYSTYTSPPERPRPGGLFAAADRPLELRRQALADRSAVLERALATEGGIRIEHGRHLIARGRHREAIALLGKVAAASPKSAAGAEARELLNRARLERALELADAALPDRDEAAAVRELEALAREPVDFAVTAARIARASLFWVRGDAANGERWMRSALEGWQVRQRLDTPAGALEADVAAIRRAVFLPQGGGIYTGDSWDGYTWPATPFLLVNSALRVTLHDGAVHRLTMRPPLPVAATVLYFDDEQIAVLKRLLPALGGAGRRDPAHIMEPPNQPLGDARAILELWTRFFPARPGHWHGWEIEAYPVVTAIEFADEARTTAVARVTIGYTGGAVELEKLNGTWVAKRITGRWIM